MKKLEMNVNKMTNFKTIIVIFILNFSFICLGSAQTNKSRKNAHEPIIFKYSALNKCPLNNKHIKFTHSKYGSFIVEDTTYNDSNYKISFILDSSLNVIHYKYKFREGDNGYDREFILINNTKIYIDTAFKQKLIVGPYFRENIHLRFECLYQFLIHNDTAVLLGAFKDVPIMNYDADAYWMLLIKSNSKWKIYSFIDKSDLQIACFGNIDCDDVFSYIQHDETDILYLWQIKKGKFILNEDRYAVIKHSKKNGKKIITSPMNKWFRQE